MKQEIKNEEEEVQTEWDIRLIQIEQKANKIDKDINNLEGRISGKDYTLKFEAKDEVQELEMRLNAVKEELSDVEDELAVQDFLEFGPKGKDPTASKKG
jgi:hypothetical protein